MTISVKRGPVIVGAVGAVVSLALIGALVIPKAGQIKDKQDQLDQAKQQQTSLMVQLERYQAEKADAPKNRHRMQILRAAVPDVSDLSGMIRLVNAAAAEADVDFISVAPGNPTSEPGAKVSTIPTQITVDGRYFAIDEFLRQLETLPRISKVTTVGINAGPKGLPQLEINLTAEFYTTDASAGPGSQPGHTAPVPVSAPNPTASPVPAAGA